MSRLEKALQTAKNNRTEYLEILTGLLKIPSISINEENKADVRRAAEYVSNELKNIGMKRIEVFETDMHPIVYADHLEAGEGAPTVLIYGHFDVQKPDPLEDWNTDPFEPTIINENLYARGATDNKGETVMCIAAVDSLLKAGPLPVNVKFLLEGEEEIASLTLENFIKENKELLACDFSLNTDGGMADFDMPSIEYGLRGIFGGLLTVFGPEKALHSGLYGGVIQNPNHVLAKLIAKIHDENGHVTLPGFYDDVAEITPEERERLAKSPKTDAAFLRESGAPALWGEKEFTAYERSVARPTCDVLFIQGGERKNAITASTQMGISFRLVPNQDPEKIHEIFLNFVEENMPGTVRWEFTPLGNTRGVLINIDSDYVQKMAEAMEAVWGMAPIFERSGGGIPVVLNIKEELGADTVLTGISLPDDNLHGPNEKIHLPTWEKGIETIIRFLDSLG